MKTPYQMLADVSRHTGHKIHLRPYDEIVRVEISDDRAIVVLHRYKVVERATEVRLVSRDLVMIVCPVGQPSGLEIIKVPDTSYAPRTEKLYGVRTADEWTERRFWESSCGSPGRGRYGAPIQAERERDYFGSTSS